MGDLIEHATAHQTWERHQIWKQHRDKVRTAPDRKAAQWMRDRRASTTVNEVSLALAKARTRMAEIS
jgi:hypothetical protein